MRISKRVRDILLTPACLILFSIIASCSGNGGNPTSPGSPYAGLIVGEWTYESSYDYSSRTGRLPPEWWVLKANGDFLEEIATGLSSSETWTSGTYKIEGRADGTYLLIEKTVVHERMGSKGQKLKCTYKILSINEKEMELEDVSLSRKFTMYRI